MLHIKLLNLILIQQLEKYLQIQQLNDKTNPGKIVLTRNLNRKVTNTITIYPTIYMKNDKIGANFILTKKHNQREC